jgi:hypothetical protein
MGFCLVICCFDMGNGAKSILGRWWVPEAWTESEGMRKLTAALLLIGLMPLLVLAWGFILVLHLGYLVWRGGEWAVEELRR